MSNATFGFDIAPGPHAHMEEEMEVTSNSPTRPMTVTAAVPQTGFNRPMSGNTGHHTHSQQQHQHTSSAAASGGGGGGGHHTGAAYRPH